jgi:hypothetical protein
VGQPHAVDVGDHHIVPREPEHSLQPPGRGRQEGLAVRPSAAGNSPRAARSSSANSDPGLAASIGRISRSH